MKTSVYMSSVELQLPGQGFHSHDHGLRQVLVRELRVHDLAGHAAESRERQRCQGCYLTAIAVWRPGLDAARRQGDSLPLHAVLAFKLSVQYLLIPGIDGSALAVVAALLHCARPPFASPGRGAALGLGQHGQKAHA